MNWKLILGWLFTVGAVRGILLQENLEGAFITLLIGLYLLNGQYNLVKKISGLRKRGRRNVADNSGAGYVELDESALRAAARNTESPEGTNFERIVLDTDKYEDGISEPLEDLDEDVWDRGYYLCPDEGGTWYELYVTESVKESYPDLLADSDLMQQLRGFKGLYLDNYVDYNQITFFVPEGEEEFTFEELYDIFA